MKCRTIKYFFILSCLIGVSLSAVQSHSDILTTKHNLSVSGPGTITATDEDQIQQYMLDAKAESQKILAEAEDTHFKFPEIKQERSL